jgi:hypothetical protein
MDRIYHLRLTGKDIVKAHVKEGDKFRVAAKNDFDWTAGDSVSFVPEDGFNVQVQFVVNTRDTIEKDPAPPLGDGIIRDTGKRPVQQQVQRGGRQFGFRCTLIDRDGKQFGWKSPKDDATSGSPDGNVHN